MWDLWWTNWQWDRFFPCQFHSTGPPSLEKGQQIIIIIIIIIIIFITGLHKKPQGCRASVASAAGHFTTKKDRTDGDRIYLRIRVYKLI
jgi:hypothetical protein